MRVLPWLTFGPLENRGRQPSDACNHVYGPVPGRKSLFQCPPHVTFFAIRFGMAEEQIKVTANGTDKNQCWSAKYRLLIRLVDELHDSARIGYFLQLVTPAAKLGQPTLNRFGNTTVVIRCHRREAIFEILRGIFNHVTGLRPFE